MVHNASASLSHPFALEVESEFAAAHAIMIGGVREPMHGHNWRVVVCVGGAKLDGEELLIMKESDIMGVLEGRKASKK